MATQLTIGRTGDFVTVADPRELGNRAQRERARDLGVAFAKTPSTAIASKLLALLGGRSNLGNPAAPGWLEGLPAAKRIVVMQELQQLVGSWHTTTGATAAGAAGPGVQGVTAEAGTIVTQAGKAAQPAAKPAAGLKRLRLPSGGHVDVQADLGQVTVAERDQVATALAAVADDPTRTDLEALLAILADGWSEDLGVTVDVGTVDLGGMAARDYDALEAAVSELAPSLAGQLEPAVKLAAASLRHLATQGGPQLGDLQVKAALADRVAAGLAKLARSARRPPRPAAGRAPGRRRTWGDLVMDGSIRIGPTAADAARVRAKMAAADKAAAAADDLPGAPDMLFKAGRAG